ncbi:MAG: flagellin [Verrucomicrobiota bacterium]
MRVITNTVSANILQQIQQLSTQQAKLQTQVATGQKLFQPEDDPAAVGRILNLESERRQVAQYGRNAVRALELSQSSFAGLQGLKKVSDRATELGTLGGGMSGPAAYTAYAAETNQLVEQALELANTRSRNDYIFGGTAVGTPPFVAARNAQGQITGVTYAGNSAGASIPLSETSGITPTTGGTTNAQLRDFINSLVALRDGLTAGNSPAISSAQQSLLTDENELVSALAEHGGIQTRIEAAQVAQRDRGDDLGKLVSGEADTDIPTTIVKLNQAQLAYQAALQSAANIMKISLLDYLH